MPFQPIILRPGVNTLSTQLLGQGGWYETQLCRFRDGYIEKNLGWSRLSNEEVTGVARSLHSFHDLDLIKYLAIGTNTDLLLYDNSTATIQEITPVIATSNLTAPFSTTNLSTTVGVHDVNHGASADDEIFVFIQTSIGGLIIYGRYTITTVIDADNYEITAASAATATVASGGDVPEFTTVLGDTEVTVVLADHGLVSGDVFSVPVSTSVGGLTIFGDYLVDTVIDPDTFTFQSITSASSGDTQSENGGDTRIYYLLPPGEARTTLVSGYGTGPYGTGTYGTSSGSGEMLVELRIWSLDNFGENLLALPTDGALYEWIPPKTPTNFATVVSAAPSTNIGMFVAMPQAQVIIYGAEVGGVLDPLLLRFCDAGNYNVWTATATNQAGSVRLSRGSRIIGGLQAPQSAYVWTESDMWQVQYIGPPFVYDVSIVGSGCGLISQNAVGLVGRTIMWMGHQGFWRFGSTALEPIPCPVWDTVFGELDPDRHGEIIAAPNSELGEMAWFYPTLADEIKMVRVNKNDEWDFSTLYRTAWIDLGMFDYPVSVDEGNLIQLQETTFDADGVAFEASALTAYYDLAEGTEFIFVDMVIPDFVWDGTDPELEMYVYSTDYPGETPVEQGPYTLSPTSTAVAIRARGRQIAFKFVMTGEDMFFRLGKIRVRSAPMGRR